jgi:hypothetical protein
MIIGVVFLVVHLSVSTLLFIFKECEVTREITESVIT